MVSLNTQIENVPRFPKKIIPALKRLGIRTVRDILFHFPARYEDFSNLKKIRELALGEIATVRGVVKKIAVRRTSKKRMVLAEAVIEDETGKIKALWFNQSFIARNLRSGSAVSLSGKVALGPEGIYLQNPAYEKIQNTQSKTKNFQNIHTGGLVAIYPETEGITSRWLRYLIKNFLELRKNLPETLPAEIRRKHLLQDLKSALYSIHFPKNIREAEEAEKRFTFEKLLLMQLRILKERINLKKNFAPVIPFRLELVKEYVASLPFELTNAQRRSMWEIFQDISKSHPMNRLLNGDVGSGKTVVAASAALLAAKAGYKTAFMAPTEILARQHYTTLQNLLSPFGVKVGLLIGPQKIISEDTDLWVGTHALIQEKIQLENLGIVIVDEQHRFGVEQRAKLAKRGGGTLTPHFLSMSATPIPRTLALTVYGDLDISVLDEIPKSRKPVITKIIDQSRREWAYEFIRTEIKKGRQAFVVCPRVEAGDSGSRSYQQKLLLSEVKAVKEEYKRLKGVIFKDFEVGMLHGKMKSEEKEAVMNKFQNHQIDILVATSVVEVGVDVPNASLMLIEGAERFGLAQLHQFRGRVGRGIEQSYCFLFTTEDGLASRRLRALLEARNGFELAEKDLELRGPGDIFGTRQWGVPDLVLKGIANPQLLRAVRAEAAELVKKDPDLVNFPELRCKIKDAEENVHLE